MVFGFDSGLDLIYIVTHFGLLQVWCTVREALHRGVAILVRYEYLVTHLYGEDDSQYKEYEDKGVDRPIGFRPHRFTETLFKDSCIHAKVSLYFLGSDLCVKVPVLALHLKVIGVQTPEDDDYRNCNDEEDVVV